MNEWMNEWMKSFIILSKAFINDNSMIILGKSAQHMVIAWKNKFYVHV